MVDLKLPKETLEKTAKAPEPMRDSYPWGTEINIPNELYGKFENLDDLEADCEVKVVAIGTVTKKECREMSGGKKNKTMSIQLKKMEVSEVKPLEKMSVDEFMRSRSKKR